MREESWPGRGDDEDFGWRRRGRGGHGGHGGHDRGRSFPGRPPFPPGPPGPPGAPMFGTWFTEPGRRGGMRGRRAKRGDVRAAALALLAEEPMNGYQIIQAIGERSDGVWRPSPGSVYPALQQLEDEGLIAPETGESGRKAFALTDEGRTYTESHADELAAAWNAVPGSVDDGEVQLRQLIRQVMVAVSQVSQAGSATQVKQAGKVLADTRRSLYRILAADETEESTPEPSEQ